LITLNFLWHQHQPDYRHPAERSAVLPWVRLHAVKGYLDLLQILERYDHARCTVNFSGILLEQLSLTAEGALTDRYAELSAKPAAELTADERLHVVKSFFSAHTANMIRTHSRYQQLWEKRQSLVRLDGYDGAAERFNAQELTDLMTWFNLTWIGFSGQKRTDVRALIARGRDFTHEDVLQVLDIHRELIGQVLPGYRQLANDGRIELSFTPYDHPILPLLCDLAAEGHRNNSDPLPDFRYPQDAAEQVRRGLAWYQQCFGAPSAGAWPAEGSVSNAALSVLAGAGLSWVATDQQNLPAEQRSPLAHLTPWLWQRNGQRLHMFFRDTRLADNMGFEYASWPPALAAAHLIRMALALAEQAERPQPVLTIALDGENPWESYPDGGEGFLTALFEDIAADGRVHCRYPREILAERSCPEINSVSAGSWIFGNFDIWARHPETRVAWRRLARARSELVDVAQGAVLDHLLAAEGSDWFWWYGDDFESEESGQFDELFRAHLIAAYEAAGRAVPDEMYMTIITERLPAAVGEITALIEPRLDGRVTTFYEWRGAVRLSSATGLSSMARGTPSAITALWYGFSASALYVCLHVEEETLAQFKRAGGRVSINITQNGNDAGRTFEIAPGAKTDSSTDLAVDQVIETCIKIDEDGLIRGSLAYLWCELQTNNGATNRLPSAGRLPVSIPTRDFEAANWTV